MRARFSHGRVWAPVVLLVLAVWAVYAQTANFSFLRLDDHDYTFLCPFVKDGLSWANVRSAFTQLRHAAIWMPLTYVSYMFDISAFGPGMGPHHLANVAFHAANTALFYALLRLLSPQTSRTLCFWAVLFWALSPVRVEPVAWIAGRKELLCAFFTLAGLVATVRAARRSWLASHGLLVFLCALGACLSKPTGMCFPFLSWIVARLSRARGEGTHRGTMPFRLGASLLLLGAFTGAVALYSQSHPAGYDVRNLFEISLPVRLFNAIKTVGFYLFQSVVPVGLHLDYRWGASPLESPDGVWVVGAGAALLAAAAGLWAFRRQRDVWLCALFFLFAVVPTLGVFGAFGRSPRADRFAYLPTLALSLGGVLVVLRRTGAQRVRQALFAGGALVGLAVSLRLVPTYENDYTAFRRVLACDPLHARALAHVGSESCARFGDFNAGIRYFRDSLACEWHRDTACQLAFALATRGRREDVEDIRALGVSTGIAKDPVSDRKGLMVEALGMAALKTQDWQEAVAFFSAAVRAPARLYPADDAWARLGVALANAGRVEEAEKVFAALLRMPALRPAVRRYAEHALALLSASSRTVLFY